MSNSAMFVIFMKKAFFLTVFTKETMVRKESYNTGAFYRFSGYATSFIILNGLLGFSVITSILVLPLLTFIYHLAIFCIFKDKIVADFEAKLEAALEKTKGQYHESN
jgi:hypothetical protein